MEAEGEKEVGGSDSPSREVGLYLYGFFVGDQASLFSLDVGPGVDGEAEVVAITYKDISLAASVVSLEPFSQKALEASLKNVEWLAEKIQIHERVVKRIAAHLPVAPIKFGTIVAEQQAAVEMIESNYASLRPFLDYVKEKEEWGVKVYLGESKFAERLGEMSPTVKELDDKIACASPGEAYILKKKREILVRDERDRIIEDLTSRIYEQLTPFSVESRMTNLQESTLTGRSEPMILNAAYLVERSKTEDLKQVVDRLAGEHQDVGLLFELTGPWPPHNFCPSLAQSD